jgi:hypothetical protein
MPLLGGESIMSNEMQPGSALNTESDMRIVFDYIRTEVKHSESTVALTNFYKLAAFLAALAGAPCWRMQCGGENPDFTMLMWDEFRKTAKEINERAETVGCELRVSEDPHGSSRCNLRQTPRSRSVAR